MLGRKGRIAMRILALETTEKTGSVAAARMTITCWRN